MKAIKFSDKELDFLREQYKEELANAEMYIVQIKEILKKLGASSTSIKEETTVTETKEPKRRGRKPKEKKAEPVEKKKRGRKPRILVPPVKEAVTTPYVVAKEKKKPEKAIAPLKKAAEKKAEKTVTKAEKKPVPRSTPPVVAKPKKKKTSKRGRPKGHITLVRLSKPLAAQKPKPESKKETTPEVEPVKVVPEMPKE